MADPFVLESAAKYAARHWYVLPIRDDKRPACAHGYKDATRDIEAIHRLFSHHKAKGVGIATGQLSKILVVDVDAKSGGIESWAKLCRFNGTPEYGPVVRTPGGGMHFYFRNEEPFKSVSRIPGFPGVELKAEGCYVCAPPSAREDGKQYLWDRPQETPLPPPPEWIRVYLTAQRERTAPKMISDDRGWYIMAFAAADMLGTRQPSGGFAVICPWQDEHTSGPRDLTTPDSSTVVFPPKEGSTLGTFHCSHSHCANRSMSEIRERLPMHAVADADKAYPAPVRKFVEVDDTWVATLDTNSNGKIKKGAKNLAVIFAHDKKFKGKLAYDNLNRRIVTLGPIDWEELAGPAKTNFIQDEDAVRARIWLSRRYDIEASAGDCLDILKVEARRREFNPVENYLKNLSWDGKRRLSSGCTDYLGAEYSPYASAVFARWMIAAVARALTPGCHADTALVLEGAQGIGKTSFLRDCLCPKPEWYASLTPDIKDDRSGGEILVGKWIVELEELSALRRGNQDAWKGYLSKTIDTYRMPYARLSEDHPRTCVFAGTTNETRYLTDPTGARRFWVLKCGAIDRAKAKEDRDQLWAEAVALFETGEQWWLKPSEQLSQEQETEFRREIDPWEASIASWLANCSGAPVSVEQVLEQACQCPVATLTIAHRRRAAACMRLLGWEPRGSEKGERGKTVKAWYPVSG